MSCFHPLSAWQKDDGSVVFAEIGSIRRRLELPCGRCVGCRLARARSWAIRCVHESQLYDSNSFVTLTYDDEFVFPSLVYRDFQLFMKRLRKSKGPTRFFMCGEYGDDSRLLPNGRKTQGKRPHFHALLFGCRFADRKLCRKDLYESKELSSLWPHGFSSIGEVSFQSAAYVARYSIGKITGPDSTEHYSRVDVRTGEIIVVEPEFAHMSLKPGIGFGWFWQFYDDVYAARDGVVVEGKVVPSPKYYDRLLERYDPKLRSEKEADRYFSSVDFEADCTPERLHAREVVALSRLSTLKRSI